MHRFLPLIVKLPYHQIMVRFINDLFPTFIQLPGNGAKKDGCSICNENPELNCQHNISKLRAVALYVQAKKLEVV